MLLKKEILDLVQEGVADAKGIKPISENMAWTSVDNALEILQKIWDLKNTAKMVMNDSLASALSHIVNCEKVGKKECLIKPVSKLILEVFKILQDKGYLGSYKITEDGNKKYAILNLIGAINDCGVIKPRFGVKKAGFEKFEKRYLPAKDFGFLIVSTSKGIMLHNDAKEKSLGGKLIAYCY